MREAMTTLLHGVQEAYEHPEGAYWVPRRMGGSAPTMAEAKALDEAELAERARKRAERERRVTGDLPALIATDVDGTLLDDDEKITARTRDAVHAAVDAGAQFVLATGRPPRWVQPVVDALGFAPMAVCANGAVIYDPSTDRILRPARCRPTCSASSPRSPPASSPARAWPSSGSAAARTTRRPRSSSAHRATSTPGSTRTTPRCPSRTCSARRRSSC